MTLPKKRPSQDILDAPLPHAKRKTSATGLPNQRLEACARLMNAADIETYAHPGTEELLRRQLLLRRLNATSPSTVLPLARPLPSRSTRRYDSLAWALAPPSIVTPCAPSPNEVVLPRVQAQGSIPDPRSLPLPPFKRTGEPSETAAVAGAGIRRNPLEMLSTLSSLAAPASYRPHRPAAAPPAKASPRKDPLGHLLPRKEAAPSPAGPRGTKNPSGQRDTKSPQDLGDTKSSQTQKASSLSDPQGGDECYVGDRCPTTGLRHGRGIMKYPNGCRYVGCFSQGRRHGFGKVWYPDGRGVYTGHWRQNRKHGKGTMHYANEDVYEGRWEDDLPHGEGKLTMTERGEAYEGTFFKKMKHGRGVYRLSNGDVYKGDWKDDVRHGAGVLISASGEVQKRMYYQGMMIHHHL